ncbi:MAG: alcohol dehydrogenase catalytic domain-containing protein [Phycisphaerae bacterium]|jgi:2-desacetyl-2-hydroxyethyl bacteriochlorophyllide A dehydrogenase
MKAAFYEGDRTISVGPCIPEAPKAGEVRLKVAYCGICGTDLHIFHGQMDKRVRVPQVIGHEMSGEVAEVGPGVKGFAVGDRVVVRPLWPCGTCPACKSGYAHVCYKLKFLGIDTPGAFQGSWTVPAHALHRLPATVSLDLGAMIEPTAVACHDVRLAQVRHGEAVVVIGGGPIGLLIALVARDAGARVLVSEVNPHRLSLAWGLGLEVVDARSEDLPARVETWTAGAGADVVFEVSGSAAGAEMMTQLPRAGGRIVPVAIFSEPQKVDLFRMFWRELKMLGARVYQEEDFERAIALVASNKLPLERLISGRFGLDELGKAFAQMDIAGAEAMKILIKCSE